jgi:hypothetical protein
LGGEIPESFHEVKMHSLFKSLVARHYRVITKWSLVVFLGLPSTGRAEDSGSNVPLKDLMAFQRPIDNWTICGGVKLDPHNRRQLATEPGEGILVSHGKGVNLLTKKSYRDCQLEVEFMIPQGSNSGVRLNGCYDIQIYDSWKKQKVTGSDCGGIYPRGEFKPHYHTIDDGTPPNVNACREPGKWQSLKISFTSPRFDANGKKTSNGKFVHVELNGVVIHENAEAKCPTGGRWRDPDRDQGPILFQGDRGPVAFRNLRIKPL